MKKFLGVMLVLALALSGVMITSAVTLTSSSEIASQFPEGSVSVEGNKITLLDSISALAEDSEPNPDYLDYDEDIVFDGGTHVVDLNGFNLCTQMADYDYGFIVKNGANVTITNSTNVTCGIYGSLLVEEGATVTLENVYVDGDLYNCGTATLNEAGVVYFPTNTGNGVMTINGGYCGGGLYSDGGKVYINGGNFNGICQDGGEMYITDCESSSGTGGLAIYAASEKTVISGGIYNPCYWEDEPDMYTHAVVLDVTAPAGTVFEADYIEKHIADGYRVVYDGFEYQDVGIEDDGNLNYCLLYRSVRVVPTSDKYSDVMKKITTTDTWTVCTDAPEDSGDSEFLLSAIARTLLNDPQYEVWAYCNDEPFNPNHAFISITDRKTGIEENYYVNVKYTQPDAAVKKNVDAMVAKMKNATTDEWKFYELEDLYLVNYMQAVAKSSVEEIGMALNFSKEFINDVGGGKFTFGIDTRLGGGGAMFYTEAGGHMIVMYEGDVYATTEGGVALKFVLYVPADTADTTDAYIAAAKKRIDAYLGANNGFAITVGGKFADLDPDDLEYDAEYIDFTNAGDSFYIISIGDIKCPIVIAKSGNTENFTTPTYKGSDLMTKIQIATTDTSVPMDTLVNIKEVKNDVIQSAVGTDAYVAYDISLYSSSLGSNITKLENGVFTVGIPIPGELANKENLIVYYVADDGTTDPHTVTLDKAGNVAYFDTDHFSTYVLTEAKDVGNISPETSDSTNMVLWGVVMAASAVGFAAVMIMDKRRKAA